MRIYILTAIFALLLGSAFAQGGTGGQEVKCPDVKASQVSTAVNDLGDVVTCGLGIKILGIGGGLFGPSCPDKKETTPAHQECKGEKSEGNKCVPDGELSVVLEDCECSSATLFGTGILIPSCDCTAVPTDGKVEDFKTALCD